MPLPYPRPFRLAMLPLLAGACLLAGCGSSRESAGRRTPPAEIHASTTQRAQLIETALSFEGVRYRYRGSDRNGMDCSGLVAVSFAAIDVKVPRTAADLYGAGSRIRRDDLIAGDLVFFSNTAGPGITHVGIYLGDGWFIHSSSSKGVIRSRLDDEYYVKHYAGGRSLLGR